MIDERNLKETIKRNIESIEEDIRFGIEHNMPSRGIDRLNTTKRDYQMFLSMVEREASRYES